MPIGWLNDALPSAWTAVQLMAGWMLADFLSGVFHWAEDRYGSPRWPVLGGAIRDTIRHHRKPRGFLAKPVLNRSWRIFLIAGLALLAFALLGWLNAFTLSLVIGAGLANEIHAAAHSSPTENGRLLTSLQRLGIIQSHAHHAVHHRNLKNVNYCTVTNWLNPVLERVRFWRRLEAVIRILTRERPRRDPVVRRRQRRRWHRRTA
ncbi:MAG: fatty acid desaturase family protein [Hyphomonadaceae bacterium]|nr:fatty acid desaturase family protein [Hyphomonadaceae bacterium]